MHMNSSPEYPPPCPPQENSTIMQEGASPLPGVGGNTEDATHSLQRPCVSQLITPERATKRCQNLGRNHLKRAPSQGTGCDDRREHAREPNRANDTWPWAT